MKLAPARFPVNFEQLVFGNREMGKEPPDEIFRGLDYTSRRICFCVGVGTISIIKATGCTSLVLAPVHSMHNPAGSM